VVLIGGEAGIGKSRLTRMLSEHIGGTRHYRLRYQCSPYHINSAFHAIIEQLTRAAKLQPQDGATERLARLSVTLDLSGSTYPHGTQLIAVLLGIPTPDLPVLNYTPQKQKDETMRAVAAHVSALAQQAPVLVLLEDAHWVVPPAWRSSTT
jgi:predicted ATPase